MEGFKCCSTLCLPKDSLPPPPARFNAVPSSASEGAAKGTKTLFNLALAMQAEGKLGDACSLYEQVVAQDRNFHDAWYNLGHIKEEQGDSSGAVRCLREALRVRPDDKESHLLMAYALESLADLNEAVEHYTAAKKLDPKCTTTLYNVANAYHDLGQLDEAAKNYRAVLELESGNVDAHFNLGVVLQDAGDLSGALAAYRAALAIDDGLEDAAAAAAGLEAALAQQAAASSGINYSSSNHKSHDMSASRSDAIDYSSISPGVSGNGSEVSGYSSFNIRSGSSGSTPPGLPPLPTSMLLSPARDGAQSSGPVEAANGSPGNPYGL